MTFTANRWAHFVTALSRADEEVWELYRKTRLVAYRKDIGNGYYVSVNGQMGSTNNR